MTYLFKQEGRDKPRRIIANTARDAIRLFIQHHPGTKAVMAAPNGYLWTICRDGTVW